MARKQRSSLDYVRPLREALSPPPIVLWDWMELRQVERDGAHKPTTDPCVYRLGQNCHLNFSLAAFRMLDRSSRPSSTHPAGSPDVQQVRRVPFLTAATVPRVIVVQNDKRS